MNKTQTVVTTNVEESFDKIAFVKLHGTKSAAIRALNAEGDERKVIAKKLGIRYQHVRNVLITPIKKQSSGRIGSEADL